MTENNLIDADNLFKSLDTPFSVEDSLDYSEKIRLLLTKTFEMAMQSNQLDSLIEAINSSKNYYPNHNWGNPDFIHISVSEIVGFVEQALENECLKKTQIDPQEILQANSQVEVQKKILLNKTPIHIVDSVKIMLAEVLKLPDGVVVVADVEAIWGKVKTDYKV